MIKKCLEFFISATLGAFGCGTGIAWSSPVLPKVSPSECQNDCDLQITEEAASWIGPIFPLAAACVGPVAFFLLNKIGRKKTLIALSFPMLIGYILLTFIREIDSAAVLLTARFLVGKFAMIMNFPATFLNVFAELVLLVNTRGAV